MRIPSELKAALACAAALMLALFGQPACAGESSLEIDKLAAAESVADSSRYFVSKHDHDEHDYDDEHDHDDDIEEIEVERIYVEMERASLETMYGAMELVEKVATIAGDDEGAAALAVVTIKDAFEHEEAVELLEEVVAKAPGKVARRLARMQLVEIYGEHDQFDKVRSHLRALIFDGD